MAQYRRSIFIINKPFQYRFAVYVCSWLVALSFVYPLIIYTLFNFFTRYIGRIPNGPSPEVLQSTRFDVMMLLATLQVVFLLITFLMSIFMSHRIAGPIYKLSTFFEKARSGDLKSELFFREKDHFQELADQYNEMIRGLRAHFEKQTATTAQAIADIEKLLATASPEARPAIENALASLRALQ